MASNLDTSCTTSGWVIHSEKQADVVIGLKELERERTC